MDFNNVTQSLRLREYYYMVARHKIWLVISVCVTMAIALTLAFSMPKIYRAQTVLLIEDETILNPLINGLAISPSVRSRMRTMREELLSWQRLTLLAEKLKMTEKTSGPLAYEKLIKNLRENIDIKLKGHDLVSVSYEGGSAKKAQEIVTTLSDIIMEGTILSVNIEANSAIQFIEEQMTHYRGKLEESEENLRRFREIYSSTLPVATRMNEQLVQYKLELSNLLVDNTEAHPRVIQTRQLIKQIEKQRDEFMQISKEAGVAISEEEYAKLVSSVPLQEQQLAKLQRDYNVNESMYQKLLQRLETAKISQTLEDSDSGTKFRVIEPARLPLVPVKPNKPLFLLGGIVMGIGLGFVIIYIIELGNTSIRNLDDAKVFLPIPIVGAIGAIKTEELIMSERLRSESHV